MLCHRSRDQRTGRIFVYRLRTKIVRACIVFIILEIGPLIQIETFHQVIINPGQRGALHATWKIVVRVRIPDRKQRCDGLYRPMARGCQKVRSRAKIGNTRRTDNTIGPFLTDHPIGNLGAIKALRGGAKPVSCSKTGTGTAHIDHDDGISAWHKIIAEFASVRVRDRGGTRGKFKTAKIRCEQHQCRKLHLWIRPLRQIDIDGKSASIAHRHIPGNRHVGQSVGHRALGLIGGDAALQVR